MARPKSARADRSCALTPDKCASARREAVLFHISAKKAANGWNFCVVLPWKMLRRELTFPAASEIMNTLKAQATDGTWSTPHGSLL